MDWWYFFLSVYFVTATADIARVHTFNIQQDERVRFECVVTSKQDAEEVKASLLFHGHRYLLRFLGYVDAHSTSA